MQIIHSTNQTQGRLQLPSSFSAIDSGFLEAIQAEDRAIRNRGSSRDRLNLAKELSLFFAVQLLVLSVVALYNFHF